MNFEKLLDKYGKIIYNTHGYANKQNIRRNIIMFEKLKNLFVEELQIDEADITMDAELIKDLGINSIELADLVLLCEEKFDIEIDDENLHKLVTVGDVADYLEEKQ